MLHSFNNTKSGLYSSNTFDNNTNELTDLPFCYLNESFINPLKNNRTEKIVLFTSEVQIKKLEMANQIFMDSTFICCFSYIFSFR